MKKIIALVILFSLALFLAGCGKVTEDTTSAETTATETSPETIAEDTATEEIPAEETAAEETTPTETTTTDEESSETTADTDTTETETIEVAGCTDTDGGKNYEISGDLVDARAITDSDRCSQNENYPGRLYEVYCKDDGNHGREIYDCPSGKCADGACVSVEESSE